VFSKDFDLFIIRLFVSLVAFDASRLCEADDLAEEMAASTTKLYVAENDLSN
jgi:hypothetical protein